MLQSNIGTVNNNVCEFALECYGLNPQLISVVAGRLVNNPERIRTAAGLRKYDRIVPDTGHGPDRTVDTPPAR